MPIHDELRALYSMDGGQDLFDWLATYRYQKSETAADRASSVTGVPYSKIVLLFKELDRIKVGKFKHGRRDYKTRIEWRYGPREVGQAAAGADVELEPYAGREDGEPKSDVEEMEPQSALPFKIIVERARNGLAADLGLSPDRIEIIIKP